MMKDMKDTGLPGQDLPDLPIAKENDDAEIVKTIPGVPEDAEAGKTNLSEAASEETSVDDTAVRKDDLDEAVNAGPEAAEIPEIQDPAEEKGQDPEGQTVTTNKRGFFEKIAEKPWYRKKGSQILVITGAAAVILLVAVVAMAASNGSLASRNEELALQVSELEDDYDGLKYNYDRQKSKAQKLEEENEELKYGKSRRLELVQAAHKDGDWEETVSLADELHEAYPGSSEDKEAQSLKADAQQKIKEAEEAKKKAEEEAARKKAEEEARGYETGITFEQLARNPDDNEGKKVKFTGEVIQVQDGSGEVQIRLAVNSDYDQVILAYYPSDLVKSKVLEDDQITIYGVSEGDYTYTSVMGAAITVPLVSVDKIDQ